MSSDSASFEEPDSPETTPTSPDYVPGPEEPEQAPLSPDYVPGPKYPEYLALSDEEVLVEDQPYATADSPVALSPGYVAKSNPEEDYEDGPDPTMKNFKKTEDPQNKEELVWKLRTWLTREETILASDQEKVSSTAPFLRDKVDGLLPGSQTRREMTSLEGQDCLQPVVRRREGTIFRIYVSAILRCFSREGEFAAPATTAARTSAIDLRNSKFAPWLEDCEPNEPWAKSESYVDTARLLKFQEWFEPESVKVSGLAYIRDCLSTSGVKQGMKRILKERSESEEQSKWERKCIDVAATFGVPLTTVGDLQKLINDIEADEVLEGGPLVDSYNLRVQFSKMVEDTRLLKEELTRIPIWVKLHDVPIQVFEE
ncbi:hypothetical protein Tco_0391266 [Tanacetum coccineum]